MKIHIKNCIFESDQIAAAELHSSSNPTLDIGDPELWVQLYLKSGKELSIDASSDDELNKIWNDIIMLMNVVDLEELVERIRFMENIGCDALKQ